MSEEFDLEESAPWLILLITLAGGWLRVLLLGAKGMWLDETFSVWLASHSIGDMLQWIVAIDQHPPLYYLLLHYWVALLGDTPYYARLLSVLFSTATIPVIYLIGKRMSGVLVGLAAAVLMALSLFNVYYAQEARMYSLLSFNAAVAMYALVRLLTDSRSVRPFGSQLREALRAWRSSGTAEPELTGDAHRRLVPIRSMETDLAWVALVLFSALTLLSHNTAVLFVLATNAFVFGLMTYQRVRKPDGHPAFHAPSAGNWVKAQIGILILWSPWIAFFIKQASDVYQRFWIPSPTWDTVLQVLTSFLTPSLSYLPGDEARAIGFLYVLALLLGLLHFRRRLSQFLFLAALFTIPILGELVVSIRRPIFYDRTLIWTTIPLLLLLAAGVAQLHYRMLIIVGLGALCTISLFSAGDYFRFLQKEDWSTAAGYVARFAEVDDLVLFNSNAVVIPFDYYFKPYERQYSLQVVRQGVPLDLFDSKILEPRMTENDIPRLLSVLRQHDRVWLVYSHNDYTDPDGLITHTLESEMQLSRERDFNGGKVLLFESP